MENLDERVPVRSITTQTLLELSEATDQAGSVDQVATEQAELNPTGTSSLSRMSTKRSIIMAFVLLATAVITTFIAMSIASAIG